jgi:C-terminal processing protease CtpA/Prc
MNAMNRRSALTLLLSAAGMPLLRAQASSPDTYSKDLEFLLSEFEQKAGHFFPVKEIDWKAVGEQFRREVKDVKDDVAHVKLCNRLLARLRDGHAGIMDLKVQIPDEAKGRRFTGPRVHLVMIGDRVYVRQSFGAGVQAGITPGVEVVRIDDTPIKDWLAKAVDRLSDERGYSTKHTALYYACHTGLADWEGTEITFDVMVNDRVKHIPLTRTGGSNYVPIGPIFPPDKLQVTGRLSYGKTATGNAYIHLRDIPGDLPAKLDRILPVLAEAPGMILDTRANGGGGCDHEAVFARFVDPGKQWRQYTGAGARPYTGPMVVIVDAGVRSAGETVAGMLKEDGRAYMIGDAPTAGMSSQKTQIKVPSGMFAVRFSVGSNKGRFNGGRGIEGIGVPPHEITPYDAADLAKGVDTQIKKAEELLAKGLPKEVVPWEASRA